MNQAKWDEIVSQWDMEIENVRDEWSPETPDTPVELGLSMPLEQKYHASARTYRVQWTDEAVELLRALAAADYSPAEMSEIFEVPNRAVWQKLSTLKLAYRHGSNGFWTPRRVKWLEFHAEQPNWVLSEFLGIKPSSVAQARNRHGIKQAEPPLRRGWSNETLLWLAEQGHRTNADIGEELGLDLKTVWQVRKELDLPRLDFEAAQRLRWEDNPLCYSALAANQQFIEWLGRQGHRVAKDIAEETGADPQVIRDLRLEFNLERTAPGRGRRPGPRGRWRPEHIQWLRHLQHKPDAWIAKKTGRSVSAIHQVRRNVGLPHRETSTTS